MGLPSLNLNPFFKDVSPGDKINIKGSLVIHDPHGLKHLLRAQLTNELFTASGNLSNLPMFSLLQGEVIHANPRPHVDARGGYVLGHQIPTEQMYYNVIETCAGMGALGEGLQSCGMTVQVSNDISQELCLFQARQGTPNVIQGDFSDPKVLAGIHAIHPFPSLLTAGFNCQPWSRLGDEGRAKDPRSGVLGKVLEGSFWLNCHGVLLECVEGAGVDQDVQALLKCFCSLTGFRQAQVNLHLEHLMPAKRSRWWDLLTNPTLPEISLQPLPKLPVPPVLGDVLPFTPEWSAFDMNQLTLDRYETNKFAAFDSLLNNIVNLAAPVRPGPQNLRRRLNSQTRTPEPEKTEKADRTLGPGQKEAEETLGLPLPMSFQAMPRDFPTAPGPSPLPGSDKPAPVGIMEVGDGSGPHVPLPAKSAGHTVPDPPMSFQAMPSDFPTALGPSPPPPEIMTAHAGIGPSVKAKGLSSLPVKLDASGGLKAFASDVTHTKGPDHVVKVDAGQFAIEGDGLTQEMEEVARTFEANEHLVVPAQVETLPFQDTTDAHLTAEEHTLPSSETFADRAQSAHPAEPSIEQHLVHVIHEGDCTPLQIRIPVNATVGSITVADDKLRVLDQPIMINTCLGTRHLLAETTTPHQQIFLREAGSSGTDLSGTQGHMPAALSSTHKAPRIQTLYSQEAWVAWDEMEYYLGMIESAGQCRKAKMLAMPLFCVDDEIEPILQQWICQIAPHDAPAGKLVTMLWVAHHWFPVALHLQDGGIKIFTTPEGHDWIKIATRALGPHITVFTVTCPHSFPNDCGFQSVGWLMNSVFDPEFATAGYTSQLVQVKSAIAWRGLFERYLRIYELSTKEASPSELFFGGAKSMDLADQLKQTLLARGVQPTAVDERAQVVLERIGRQPLIRAFRSADPWREIKALANHLNPKLQLVLASEMEVMIANRVQQGKAFGLVVVDATKAMPYLRIAQPLSKSALALIVVNHQDPLVQEVGMILRFPAKCERTGEAILLTARVIQLGTVDVIRIQPQAPIKIDEVKNHVFRTVTYRDELEGIKWTDFIARPIKHVIAAIPALQPNDEGANPILDIWDRQFLSERLERCRPSESVIYMACFRVASPDQASESPPQPAIGHYIEPRTPDGRSPDPQYRVVWLNKADRQSAVVASQQTPQWNAVVRSGRRFGLRTKVEDTAQVHTQHKPSTPFLDSDKLMTFHAGPFPHGASRAALLKLFGQWHWPARPCQPKSRSPNGLGVIWEIQATTKPPYEVYQLQHADVLITEIPKVKAKPTQAIADIQGSAKTLAALSSKAGNDPTHDPWEVDDPWSGYQTPIKTAKVQHDPLRPDQIDALVGKVTQKVLDHTKSITTPMDDGDTPMASDERLQHLEERMSNMEKNMQAAQTYQQQHNAEVATQMGQLQQQVDQQSATLTSHLDNKMAEQLAHIERLLLAQEPAKKGRYE
eukprot:s50_g57.t1